MPDYSNVSWRTDLLSSPPIIETERLLLRPIVEDDLGVWTQLTFADPEVMRYHNRSDLTPRARAEKTLAWHTNNWAGRDYGGLLVTGKTDGRVYGDCYLEPASETGEIELGYSIGKQSWGQGIATEASRAMVRFGIEEAELGRIIGVVVPENIGSWRVLEKVGFIFERDDNFYDFDVRYYAIEADRFEPDDSRYIVHDS